MRVECRVLLLVCAFFLVSPFSAWGHAGDYEGYDGEQILLSWSEEAAHSQTVTWHSPSQKAGYVQYNESGKALSNDRQVKAHVTKVEGTDYYRYEAVIKGLSQQMTYDYRIGDGKTWGKVRNFTTAPIPGNFEFLYLGDVQYQNRYRDYKIWGRFVEDIRERHPGIKFALSGGDMVNYGKHMKEWELFLQSAEPVFSYIPLMTTVGNHETPIKDAPYLQLVALPKYGPKGLEEEFYSFDYANCHITVLNSCFFEEDRQDLAKGTSSKEVLSKAPWEVQREQINRWLQEGLAQSKAKWKIVVMHHPAYGISDGDPIYDQIRQQWEPILKAGGVDVVFCGHQHLYARTKEIGGITYIMGNSGKRRSTYFDGENVPDYMEAIDATNSNYQIVRVSDDELSVTAYDEEGQIIDKWTKDRGSFPKVAVAAFGIFAMHVLGIGVLFILKRKKRRH